MLIALVVFSLAVTLVALFPSLLTFAVFLILMMGTKFIFDPALQAYLGDRTPYHRRALVIAFNELGWSGAALVGIPLLGLLIARGSWRSAFWPLGVLGLAALAGLWLVIPRDAPPPGQARASGRDFLALIRANPYVVAALSLGFFASAANENLGVVYARWLEAGFGLSVRDLGFSITIIGLAELLGEGLVMGLADRLGKRRAIALGLIASAVAYVALPFADDSLNLALAGLFIVYVAFEFTIVASIPMMTELLPEARGRVMSTNMAFHAGGRMVGALLGGFLFPYGFLWNGVAAVGINLIALAVIILFVRERR
jgi:predicted MFS family arabinose efflux permease